MKKLIGAVSVAALVLGVTTTSANAQHYVEGSIGAVTQDSLDWEGTSYDMDSGWSGAVAVGTTMWTHWDVEAELSYDKMDYSCCSSHTKETRLMLNATRNFDVGGFTPYIGAGVGAAWVTYGYSGYHADATEAAYQLIGGVRVPLGDNWSIFGEYRYQNLFSDARADGIDWEHSGHNFLFGARYNLH